MKEVVNFQTKFSEVRIYYNFIHIFYNSIYIYENKQEFEMINNKVHVNKPTKDFVFWKISSSMLWVKSVFILKLAKSGSLKMLKISFFGLI